METIVTFLQKISGNFFNFREFQIPALRRLIKSEILTQQVYKDRYKDNYLPSWIDY